MMAVDNRTIFGRRELGGGRIGQDIFILLGFSLLGLSYGQAAGAVNSNFEPRYRYTGAALTSDLAWLIGAAKVYGVKAVNPGGVAAWKWGKDAKTLSAPRPVAL